MLRKFRLGTRKAQIWLSVSIFLLGLQVVAFGFSQAALYRFYATKAEGVSDNQTWVVSQLDVDFQKLKVSLFDAELTAAKLASSTIPADKWASVMLAFDIYYSRVSTIESQITLLEAKGDVPKRYADYVSLIKSNRNDLSKIIDDVRVPDTQVVQQVRALLAQIEVAVREIAVDTLFVLSRRADFEQQTAYNYIVFHVTVSLLTVALLIAVSATIFVMLRDARNQYSRLQEVLSAQDQLIRQMPRALFLTDENGKILRSNKSVEKLLGWTESEAVGRQIGEMIPVKRRKYWNLCDETSDQLGLTPGQSTTLREIAVGKSGSRFPVEILLLHLKDAGSSAYLFIVRSIALEQRAMRALRRDRTAADKLAVRNSRLLSVMSHEMRTPLHGVIAALDLAKLQKLNPEAQGLVNVALEAAQAALNYADDALKIVGIELNPQISTQTKFSPRDIVCEVVEMLRPAAVKQGNSIVTEFGSGVEKRILGHAELLRHSISNLLGNAIKFTTNGKITVRLFSDEEANSLKVEVIDTGIGITPKQQELIFSDYITQSDQGDSNWQGSGLGLGLFKRAVSVMRGQWGVSSEPGKGSAFWFTFPVQVAEPEEELTTDSAASSILSLPDNIKILVVDDNNLNLVLLGKMLDVLGIAYELANGGKEALAKASETSFDIILLDIGMPDINGYEVAQEIRKTKFSNSAHILALTADSSINLEEEMFRNSEMDDLLLKPIKLDALREKLSQFYLSNREKHLIASSDTPASDEVLDQEVVDQFIALDGIEGWAPLVETLLDQAVEIQTSLENATDENLPDLASQFHGLAGAAGMMGAKYLAKVARDCEKAVVLDSADKADLVQYYSDAVEITRAKLSALHQ